MANVVIKLLVMVSPIWPGSAIVTTGRKAITCKTKYDMIPSRTHTHHGSLLATKIKPSRKLVFRRAIDTPQEMYICFLVEDVYISIAW